MDEKRLRGKRRGVLFILLCITTLSDSSTNNSPLRDLEGSGNNADGSGDGSGFGSGDGPSPPTDNCASSNTSFTSVSEEDTVLEGRCRSLCLEKILHNESLSIELFAGDGFYRTVSTGSLRENCRVYQQVYECTVGCQMGMEQSSCASNCYDRCMLSSEHYMYLPDSSCLPDCERHLCSLGCSVYTELTGGSIPVSPQSSFSVLPFSSPFLHAAATYTIEFAPSPPPDHTSLNQSIVSFVVQVSDGEHTTHYWQPSLDTPLQLGSFLVCKTVQIRFRPVSKFGPAKNYSSSLSVETYGDIWPSLPDHPAPYSVVLSQNDDSRPGYWEHAILTVSWQPPNRAQYLESYSIKIHSPNELFCGESKEVLGLNQPMYVWKAESPADGPINNCTYQIQVLSEPHTAKFPGPQENVGVEVQTVSNAVPSNHTSPVNIICFFDDSEGNFLFFKPSINWSLPLNPVLAKGIKHFELSLSAWKMDNEMVKLDSWKSTLVEFEKIHNIKTQRIAFNASYEFLIQELNIVYYPGYPQYLSSTHSCKHHIVPPPPVVHITPDYMIWNKAENVLYINITWESPEFPQGKILHYDIYLGEEVLTNDTEPLSSLILIHNDSSTSIKKKFKLPAEKMKEGTMLNLQVRATSSLGLKSVWSSPYQYNPHGSEFLGGIDFVCGRVVSFPLTSSQTFDLFINWTVTHQIVGLDSFNVYLRKQAENGTLIPYKNSGVDYRKSVNKYSEAFKFFIWQNDETYPRYTIQLEPIFSLNYPKRTYSLYSCDLDGRRVQPHKVLVVNVTTFTINQYGELDINMNWKEPQVTAGGIFEYQVYVGFTNISGLEEPNEYLMWEKQILRTSLSIERDSGFAESLVSFGRNSGKWKFSVQVRPKSNSGSTGVWSDPFFVEREAFVPQRPTQTQTPTISTSPSLSSSPETTSTDKPETNEIDNKALANPLVPVMSAIVPIIFVLVIAILLVSVLLLIAYCQNRNIRNKSEVVAAVSPSLFGMGNSYERWDKWELPPSSVDRMTLVGEGTFGEVYQGMLQRTGRGKKDQSSVPVLVNSLRVAGTDEELLEFTRRLEKHKMVANFQHPFFLTLMGCITVDQPFYLVTEMPENGDLLTFLQKHKTKLRTELKDSSSGHDSASSLSPLQHPNQQEIRPADLINFARQIASAMDCLAGLGIVHSDLAARNVYIDQSHTLKVSDFGIVSDGKRDEVYVNGRPLRWLSPEVLVNHAYSTASDIWAFGVTLWEIITLGEFPYYGIADRELLQFLKRGGRLPKPTNCSLELFTILQVCWEKDQKVRPSFEILHETLLNRLTRDETSLLISVHPSHFAEGSKMPPGTVESERHSPTSDNSSDSAISEDRDIGVDVAIKQGRVSDVTNLKSSRQNAHKTTPIPSNPSKCLSRGFRNPGFRRTSLKAVDLDSPSLQVSRKVPPINSTIADLSEGDLPDTSPSIPDPTSTLDDRPTHDGSTEV